MREVERESKEEEGERIHEGIVWKSIGIGNFSLQLIFAFSPLFCTLRSLMEFKVFGCKTNKYFAEKWLVHPHLENKDGYFIASCVVTDKAKAKWVKHAKKKLPTLQNGEKLYLSGCGNIRDGVVDPRFYEVYDELADYRDKIEILPEDPDDYAVTAEEKRMIIATKIRSLKKLAGRELFTRKYMVIQTGCDNFCTFCFTVQAR